MAPSHRLSRRKFIQKGGALSLPLIAAGLPASSLAGIKDAGEFLRLGWVGVGGRGTTLLGHALNSVSVATLKVTAICDIDAAARGRAVERCGAMKPVGYEDYRTLLEAKDVDAVFIATPVYLHEEHAVAAIEAGKHTYCEKPLSPTASGVRHVYDAVKRSKQKFQVGFQWRYHSAFLALVDHVQKGGVGKVSLITAERHVGGYPDSGWYVDRNLSGDLIVEQAVHEMNVLCWLLQSHPLRAAGFGGINALAGRPAGRTLMDAYGVTFDFPEDIRVHYGHSVYAADGFGRMHQTVYGSHHQACSLVDTTRLYVTRDGKKAEVELPPLTDATEHAIQSFARAIREDKEPLANVDAGRHATLMAILGRTAIHERRVVEWSEVAG